MSLSIVRKPYRRWTDAVHLSNGHAEVVIIPSGGRIIRYGRPGGSNILWENPFDDPATADLGLRGWHNPGGDKVWIWPDGQWKNIAGKAWPPMWEMDAANFEITINDDAVRLVSPPVPAYGLRIVREIQLDDDSSALQSINRFEPVGQPTTTPVGLWTVTQVPALPRVMALVEPGSEVRYLSFERLAGADLVGPAAVLRRDPAQTTKVGLDGTAFRIEQDGVAFTQRLVGTSDGEWAKGERAQFYVEQDQPHRSTYMELELTSPRAVVTDDGPWTAVRWELLDV